jgi:hypothetical protein
MLRPVSEKSCRETLPGEATRELSRIREFRDKIRSGGAW